MKNITKAEIRLDTLLIWWILNLSGGFMSKKMNPSAHKHKRVRSLKTELSIRRYNLETHHL